jgi:hypothetical protein
MFEARPAMTGDIEGVCDLLHREMNAQIPVARWRRLMTYGWLADKPDLGCVVEEGGRIVGYMGVIYADRQRHGQRFRTGNLTSWYLEKPYRASGAGMELLRLATRHGDVVYTSFSSAAKAAPLLRLGGLRPLDSERFIWRRRAGKPASGFAIAIGAENVLPLLGHEERQLLADHADFAVHPYAIRGEGGDCLVLLSIHEKAGQIVTHEALYVGAPEIFAPAAQDFADAILPAGPAVLAVDKRFLGDSAVDAETQAIRVPRYFRPAACVGASDIDILYSEIELLDLKLW